MLFLMLVYLGLYLVKGMHDSTQQLPVARGMSLCNLAPTNTQEITLVFKVKSYLENKNSSYLVQ